jgi:hypothetical protein
MSKPGTAQLSRTTADRAVRDCALLISKRPIVFKAQKNAKPRVRARRVVCFFAASISELNKHRGSL